MKAGYFFLMISLVSISLAACSANPAVIEQPDTSSQIQAAVQATITSYPFPSPYPTYTYYPTYLPKATYTPRIVITIRVVTATHPAYTTTSTYTPGPTHTPYPTNTPIPPEVLTATAQAALDALLKKDHGSGIYLVGVDIAPGVWRSTAGHDDCYWSRTDKTGDIIDNFYGMSGGTIYISPSDFQVELDDCGIWTWLSPP